MKRRLIVLVLAAVALIATGAVAGRLLYRAYPVQGDCAVCRSDPQLRPVLGSPSRRNEHGTEPGLQDR